MPKSTKGTVNGEVPEREVESSAGTSSLISGSNSDRNGDSVPGTGVSLQVPAQGTVSPSVTYQAGPPGEPVVISTAGSADISIQETGRPQESQPTSSAEPTSPEEEPDGEPSGD
jgi:hypothetical protein